MYSSLPLHIKHQSTLRIPCFCYLNLINTFPFPAPKSPKTTLFYFLEFSSKAFCFLASTKLGKPQTDQLCGPFVHFPDKISHI